MPSIKRYDGTQWVNVYPDIVSNASTANTIVLRDGSGNFTANVITATTFSGSGASLTSIPNSATTATSASTNNTIVLRDGSGNFSAGTITATLNGSAPAGSLSGSTLASGVTASSLTSVGTLSTLTVSGNVTFDGTSIRFPTNLVDVTLGSNPTSGDRLRLHRSGSNSFVDFSGALTFRSGGDSEDLVVQSNGVTRIDRPSHTYAGTSTTTAAQTIPSATQRPIIFDSSVQDFFSGSDPFANGMHAHAVTSTLPTGFGAYGYVSDTFQWNTRILIPLAGFWQFWATVPFAANSSGGRIMDIRHFNAGGTLQTVWRTAADAGDSTESTILSGTASFNCALYDYIQVTVEHNAGVNLNVLNGFGISARVGWTLLRATP